MIFKILPNPNKITKMIVDEIVSNAENNSEEVQ